MDVSPGSAQYCAAEEADLTRRNRNLWVKLLSLALLLAQWGMLAHASTHLKADPHAAPAKAQFCGECLAFAPLQNTVGSAPAVVLVVPSAVHRIDVVMAGELPPLRAFDAFRSRAPPHFL